MDAEFNLGEINERIEKNFNIEEITYGSPKQIFIVRYRGELKDDNSELAFEKITDSIKDYHLLPLIKRENDQVCLTIMPDVKKGKSTSPRLNLVLFILTLVSVIVTGGLYSFNGEVSQEFPAMILGIVKSGWPYALTLLSILAAHEFGHYFAGRKHGVQVSLPFFIPMPLSLFGTMGAFINMRSLPKNRRALFDLAVSGPISGFILSVLALIIGLNLSEVSQLPFAPAVDPSMQMEGNSLLYLLMKYSVFGKILPQVQGISGVELILYWLKYFFTGQPFPWGAWDVMLHPVAWAGWAGLFVTGINLIPIGQLDGGHIFYTLFGEAKSKRLFPLILITLGILGIFSNVWWIWAVLLLFLGRRYAQPLDQITQLDKNRKIFGYIAMAIFILTFVPVPITIA